MQLVSRVVALDFGEVIAEGLPDEIVDNPRSVSAAYGKAVALESVTLHIKAGELVAILGPNGAGKSTLLKVISRSLNAQGTLEFEGRSLHDFSTEAVVGQ
eukprot:gene15130-20468_t